MMINNLPEEEVRTVMGYMKHAVKDTYFEKWLASGGFQWPTNNAPNNNSSSKSHHGLKTSITKRVRAWCRPFLLLREVSPADLCA